MLLKGQTLPRPDTSRHRPVPLGPPQNHLKNETPTKREKRRKRCQNGRKKAPKSSHFGPKEPRNKQQVTICKMCTALKRNLTFWGFGPSIWSLKPIKNRKKKNDGSQKTYYLLKPLSVLFIGHYFITEVCDVRRAADYGKRHLIVLKSTHYAN